MLENIRNRLEVEFIKNCENDKIITKQSKTTLIGLYKSYTTYSSYTLKKMK